MRWAGRCSNGAWVGKPMPALLIKNGRGIDPAASHDAVADVWIEDGLVKGVGPNLSPADAKIFDATGLIVAPGFIDMPVHLREPGFEHSETLESGARAAASGGFKDILPRPTPAPVTDSPPVTPSHLAKPRQHAGETVVPI